MSIDSVMPSNHLILCCPLLLLPSIFPSIRVFQWVSSLHQVARWPITGVSATASVLPMNTQGWFTLGLSGLIPLLSKGLLRVFSNATVQNYQFFGAQPSLRSNSHLHTTTGKTTAWTMWTFVSKLMSLLLNTLSRFFIVFLQRRGCLLILWLQSLSADFEAQENKICHCFHFFRICFPWIDGTGCHDLSVFNVEFFHSPLSPSSRGSLFPLFFLP